MALLSDCCFEDGRFSLLFLIAEQVGGTQENDLNQNIYIFFSMGFNKVAPSADPGRVLLGLVPFSHF